MKYLIDSNSNYICHIKSDNFNEEYYLVGFLEKEPTFLKFLDGFLAKSFIDDSVKQYPWDSLQISLETLNRLLNDLHTARYKIDYQKDKLAYCQIEAIQSNLYDNCLRNAVIAEGVSPEIADIIISKSYDSGHSAGYSEIVCHCWDNIDFAKKILAAK